MDMVSLELGYGGRATAETIIGGRRRAREGGRRKKKSGLSDAGKMEDNRG
jgi:hypothetical protein